MHDYQKLDVHKRARGLVSIVYSKTARFPTEEKYGLVKQMRGSAISIGANLAEGAGRLTPGEFRQFVSQSPGSAHELEWHTMIATDLAYLAPDDSRLLQSEIVDGKKLLNRLAKSLPPGR